MKKIKVLSIVLCAVMLFGLMSVSAFAADCTADDACTATEHDTTCPKYVAPAAPTITLKKEEQDVCLGGYLQKYFTATGEDNTVIITSSNPDVAKVYENGTILGKQNGTATIHITVYNAGGSVSDSFIINVGHDYDVLYNENVHWTVCTRCDYKTEETAHDMRDWAIITMPTTGYTGSEKRSCRGCNYAEFRDLDPASNPPTGDDSMLGMWLTVAVVSFMALGTGAVMLKKRNEN